MPIYSYRCEVCGHLQDVLQKMSDQPLQLCPSCGAADFRKQITAAGFQLKGSGWYATDFRNPPSKEASKGVSETDGGGNAAAAGKGEAQGPGAASGDPVKPAAAPATDVSASGAKSGSGSGSGSGPNGSGGNSGGSAKTNVPAGGASA